MERRDLLIEKIERIKAELNVSDVAKDFIQLKRAGASFKAICPFHSDHSMGSFIITDSKGIFKCFSCGTGGDCIKFYSLMKNLSYTEGAVELGYSKGIINPSEYDILTNYKMSNKNKCKIEKIFIQKDNLKLIAEKADIKILDEIYRLFIQGNNYLGKPKLNVSHYEHLKDERCLSDESIENDLYFTFPQRPILKYFLADMEKNNLSLDLLKKIPGFFYDKKKESYEFMTVKGGGIGIPIINEFGLIEAIQIRKDVVEVIGDKKAGKYIFFSSSFAMDNDNFDGGVGCGSPVDVTYPETIESKVPCRSIFITEGRFKSKQIAKTFNSIAVSVQGVTSWKKTIPCIKNIQDKYKNKYCLDTIIIAFDADLGYNVGVLEQAIKAGLTLGKYSEIEDLISSKKLNKPLLEKKSPKVFFALWDVDDGKGIDDLILNGHQSKIRKISLEGMYNLYIKYKEVIYQLIDKKEYYEIKDIPLDVMKGFFEDIVLSQILDI